MVNMRSKHGFILIVVPLLAFVWLLADPSFLGKRYLAIPAGVSVIILALAWRKQAVSFGSWLSLAVLGQAVALQLINAGPYMRYQHFKEPKALLTSTHPLLLAILVIQVLAVTTGLIRHHKAISGWITSYFRIWEIAFLAILAFVTGATVSERVGRYLVELLFAGFIQAVNLGNLALVALSIPRGEWAWLRVRYEERLRRFASRYSVDWYVVLAVVWTVVLTAGLAVFSYQRHPHVPDEVAYVQQANFFAAGHLTNPTPRVPEAFDFYLMEFDGDRWYPCPPPGWSAILALGAFVGLAWLVNPLVAGLNVLLAFFLLRHLYDARLARLALFFFCFSPWFIFMGMNFMTHMSTLACALLAALSIVKARHTRNLGWAATAGVFLGFTSLIRPLDGLILGFLLGLWVIGVGGRRLRLLQMAAFGVGTLIVGGLALPYNYYLTGSPLRFPIMHYTDERFGPGSNAFGFGPNRGMGWPIDPFPGHGPIDALVNGNLNTFSVNIELFGWIIGSLLLIAFFLVRARWQRSDWLMISVIVAVFVAHFFYYFSGGPDFGARYWFLIIVPCIALSVRGLQVLAESTERHGVGWFAPLVLVSTLCFCTLVNYFPWRAVDKYYHYLNMRPDVRELAKEHGFGKSLVLIQGEEHPDYASAAAYNPVDIRGADAPVYAWDRTPDTTARLLKAYPDRPVWILRGPTRTGKGYQILAGPLAAGAARITLGRGTPLRTVLGDPTEPQAQRFMRSASGSQSRQDR